MKSTLKTEESISDVQVKKKKNICLMKKNAAQVKCDSMEGFSSFFQRWRQEAVWPFNLPALSHRKAEQGAGFLVVNSKAPISFTVANDRC